jgi:AcrR family transcriptional regulator
MPHHPKKRRPDARPGEILAAALDLFSERGFAATRMEDVAARAGLSKAAIYLYFADKTALLRAIVDDAIETNITTIRDRVLAQQGPVAPMLRTLLATFATVLRTTRFPDLIKLIISESRARPEIGHLYLDHAIGRAFPLVQSLIARGIATGEFREVDPAMTVRSIVGPMLLAALWRSVFEPIGAEPLDIDALARHHADLILAGLRP